MPRREQRGVAFASVYSLCTQQTAGVDGRHAIWSAMRRTGRGPVPTFGGTDRGLERYGWFRRNGLLPAYVMHCWGSRFGGLRIVLQKADARWYQCAQPRQHAGSSKPKARATVHTVRENPGEVSKPERYTFITFRQFTANVCSGRASISSNVTGAVASRGRANTDSFHIAVTGHEPQSSR